MLAWVIDLDYQGDIGPLLTMKGRNRMSGIQEILRVSPSITRPCVKVKEKLQQLNPGRTTYGPDPLGMRLGLPHQVKSHNHLKVSL